MKEGANLHHVDACMMKQKAVGTAHCTKAQENVNYIPSCYVGLLSALEQVTS